MFLRKFCRHTFYAIAACRLAGGVLFGGALLAAPERSDTQATLNPSNEVILMIASYNPDTWRMNGFITKFEDQIDKQGISWRTLVEDMGCKGVDEAPLWRRRMAELLEGHRHDSLKAIILLGQEAWASFLAQDKIPQGVPFFGCFASANGVMLPRPGESMQGWMPASVNMIDLALSKGIAGGHLNHYDLARNVHLITSRYPDTRHIAFVSDNTYGGISLQALVRSQEADFPDIDFLYIDGRNGEQEAVRRIAALPPNTVVLLGTWRVGRNGEYLMYSSMASLMAGNPTIPVFTLSGTGLNGVAIGGYIPLYNDAAEHITWQIDEYYKGRSDAIQFDLMEGEYRFDRNKLKEFGIEEYKLPRGSVIIDSNEARFQKYRKYIAITLGILVILSLFVVFLYYLYYKNKALAEVLQAHEKELISAKERAEESDRLKSAFLANMSHEIRTPLNAIVGFSSLLVSGELDPEEQAEYQRIIAINSELMLTLIGDILDISRLETGKMNFKFEPVDIVSLCRQAILTTGHNRKPGVACRLECDYESYLLNTDVQRLSQVLINLLTNANKFTRQGEIVVNFRELPACQQVQFSISDTGSGIPIEKQGKVFERFVKLDEFTQGTGLGLSICKQITYRLGGDIWVDPGYRTGTRFIFTHATNL